MDSIQSRLSTIEDEFISALLQGEGSIAQFDKRWEQLMQDVDQLSLSVGLNTETAVLVHTTAMRVATLAETSADLYDDFDNLTTVLVDDLDSLVSELSLQGSTSHQESHSRRTLSMDQPLVDPSQKKRRRSSSSDDHPAGSKRKRTSSTPMTLSSSSPSACPWETDGLLSLEPLPSGHIKTQSESDKPMTKRKRRLSDADAEARSHCSKRLHAGPRLHAVSDSYAITRDAATRIPRPRKPTTPEVSSMSTLFDIQPLVSTKDMVELLPLDLWGPSQTSDLFNPAHVVPPLDDANGVDDLLKCWLDDTGSTVMFPLPYSSHGNITGLENAQWQSSPPSLTDTSSTSSSPPSTPVHTPCSITPPLGLSPLNLGDTSCPDKTLLSVSHPAPASPSSFYAPCLQLQGHEETIDPLESLLLWLSSTPLPQDPVNPEGASYRGLQGLKLAPAVQISCIVDAMPTPFDFGSHPLAV